MRCQEARKRIDAREGYPAGMSDDPDLGNHLQTCDACRRYAALSGAMQKVYAFARVDDTAETKSIDGQRREVEGRLRTPDRFVRRARRSFFRKPAFGLSVSVAVAALLVLALVPFSYYQTVGYDLNLRGVSRHLAHDDEQICELLVGLGLVDAGVDVKGCDTTCSLAILDLKTETEAHLVAGAIARLNETDLTTSIVPIRARSTRSLLEQANDLIRRGDS